MNISPINFLNKIQNTAPKPNFGSSFYVQKPDTFERTTPKTNKNENYNNVIKSLTLTNENALVSLKGQIALDGWAGKTADWISGAWNSKNRAHLVQADIDTQKAQIEELKQSIKENKFDAKFQEIFGVKYDQKNIDNYTKKADEFKLAVTTKCMADITEEKLGSHIEDFKNNKGILQGKAETKILPMAMTGTNPLYTETTSKEDVLNNFKKALVSIIGSEKRLNNLIEKNGVDMKTASDEKKYQAYGAIGNYLLETSKATAKKCSGGKTLEQLDTEYENSYQKAYGNKNNIQVRVDKYNRSQEIGAAVVRGVVRSGIVAATVATAGAGTFIGGLAVGSSATFGAKMLAEVTDKMTNDIDDSVDLSSDNIKKMVKSAAISSADYIASRGIKKLIPDLGSTNETLNTIFNLGKDAVIDTTTGMIGEYYKQGQWNTSQIIPRLLISATFNAIDVNDPSIDQLKRLSKGGLNQAMKKKHRDYDAVREFVQGTKIMLDENYTKNPEKYSDLKVLATKNPEKYEEYVCALLEAELNERNNVSTSK